MKWHFRTIGMGTINYRKASSRLAREVAALDLFDSSSGHDETFLVSNAPIFWENHKEILKARVPGFGWWIWKPEFIARCLDEIPEGDGILYLDAGSYVENSEAAQHEIQNMLRLGSVNSIVGAHGQPFIESNYSSYELMSLLHLTASQRELPQHWAGFLLAVNNEKGRKFVNDWRCLCCANNHEYLIPSRRTLEDTNLIHHMYDQAILSCLIKSGGHASIEIGDKQIEGVIRGVRHRYAYPFNEKTSFKVIFYRAIGFASRLRLAVEHRIFRDSLKKKPSNHK